MRFVFCLIYILLLVGFVGDVGNCQSNKKIKIFPFFELKDGKYIFDVNAYSYGTIKSVYSVLKYIGYDISEPKRTVNFSYGDIKGMIELNKGIDWYILGEYTFLGNKLNYKVSCYNNLGDLLWTEKFSAENSDEGLLDIVDKLTLRLGDRISGGKVDFVLLNFGVDFLLNKVYEVYFNDTLMFDRIVDKEVKSIRILGGVKYNIKVYTTDTKDLILDYIWNASNEEKQNVILKWNDLKLPIKLSVGSGSDGFGLVNVEFPFNSFVSLDGRVGVSGDVEEDVMFSKIRLSSGVRYYLLSFNYFRGYVFSRLFSSFLLGIYDISSFDIGVGNVVGVIGGVGFKIWKFEIEMGANIGYDWDRVSYDVEYSVYFNF